MTKEDTSRVNLLIEISKVTLSYDPITALNYGNKSLELAEKIKYREGIVESYNRLGVIHNNIGNFDLAIEYFKKCIPFYEKEGDKKGWITINNSMGRLYFEQKDYSKALSYFRRTLSISNDIDDKNNIASSLLNTGLLLDYMGKRDSAYLLTQMGLNLLKQLGDSTKIPSAYLNIGEFFERQGELIKARENYFHGLEICKTKQLKPRLVDSYDLIGRWYYKSGDYNLAISYLDSAFVLANELGLINRIKAITKTISEVYNEIGQIDQAFDYLTLYNKVNDSIKEMSVDLKLALLEWERAKELEKQIMGEETRRQRLMKNFALIAFILMLILAGVLYRNYRIKQKSNQLLAEIDQLKSRMFSNISHEFRTPLTLILGPLEEMLQEGSATAPSAKTLKMMRRNADRLLNLVNQMMDLSKMDEGQLKLELTEGDVIQAVKIMVLAFSSMAESKKIQYEYHIPDGVCKTFYDRDKIEKIVNNLLSNAFKFTPQEGKVIVRFTLGTERKTKTVPPFTCEAPVLKFVVEDTGKGIPKDQLKKVFDRFHQVEGSYELENIGTGIGLALTQELVDLMHGTISVESTPGKGSTFSVSIPLGKEHLAENEYTIIEGKEAAIRPGSKYLPEEDEIPSEEGFEMEPMPPELPTILIVEDHADIRQHIRENMSYFNILEAENGNDGFDQAAENIPDLIITDLMMPEMDGVELCKNLKTDERTSHIPVIMLTAKASVEDRIEGLETGADDYITKPFNMKELKVRINNLIEQRKKLRERFTKEVNLGPKDIAVTSADERFLNRIIEIIEKNIQDTELDVAGLSDQVAMSRMQLYRKTKALTDQTPSEFIRTIRLKRAAQLMRDKYGNIAEITYEVGFNHPSYFAKSFRELFGESPSDYIKNH